jgi:hypothetical protein
MGPDPQRTGLRVLSESDELSKFAFDHFGPHDAELQAPNLGRLGRSTGGSAPGPEVYLRLAGEGHSPCRCSPVRPRRLRTHNRRLTSGQRESWPGRRLRGMIHSAEWRGHGGG